MKLDEIIIENAKRTQLYGNNNAKKVKKILGLPENINIKRLYKEIDSYHEIYYTKKKTEKKNMNKADREKKFLEIKSKNSEMYKEIPDGESTENFRTILTVSEQWMKKSHKKINKILMNTILTKKERGKKQKSLIPYLHSSVKQRSYASNANEHIGEKYALLIDLKDFYPSVTKGKIFKFFKKYFDLDSDIAMFYAVLSTVKKQTKSEEEEYVLGQGLSQSAILAFLVNASLFNYIYEEAKRFDITMSVYVDDVTFSSIDPIPQAFIDKLFGLFKKNDMEIKKEKIYLIGKDKSKKITGVYVNGKKTRVSNEKHMEVACLFNHLSKKIEKIDTKEKYFEIYNIYLKFCGNYEHVKTVEKKVSDKYTKLIEEFSVYFPRGINKRDSKLPYQEGNIKGERSLNKIESCYNGLISRNEKNYKEK